MQTVDQTVQVPSKNAKRVRGPRTPAEKARRTLERREFRKKRDQEDREARKGKHKHGSGGKEIMNCVLDKEPLAPSKNFNPTFQILIHCLRRRKELDHFARLPLRTQMALRDNAGI